MKPALSAAFLILSILVAIHLHAEPGDIRYTVSVTTSVCNDAGTDANVCLTMCGTDASGVRTCTPAYVLDNEGCNDFEIASRDTFDVRTSIDFTQIDSVTLSHDNKGKKPGWLPDRVTIVKADAGTQWQFCYRRWLANDECDGSRTVTVTSTTPCADCFEPRDCFTFGKQQRQPPNCVARRPVKVFTP